MSLRPEQTRTGNRDYFVRRIAWRLQARVEGDLSERARKRAAELADDADLRTRAPAAASAEGARHLVAPSRATSRPRQKERKMDLNPRDRLALIVRPEAVDALRTGESR